MTNEDPLATSRTSSNYVKTSLIKLRLLTAVIAGALTLTACEDPSNVGLGLVGEQGGRPVAAEEAITDFRAETLGRPSNVLVRVLAGVVDDPLLGTITAEGYVDFVPVSSSDFRAGTVQSAELRLLPTYVYGDTTAEVTLAVRPVSAEWDDEGLPIDTTISVGGVIREFTFRPTDSLVVVPMPDTWVTSNDELLRSADFAEDFHGFRLDHISGNAVMGFGPTSTVLRARTEDDSASFPIAQAYAALRKQEAALPPNRLLVQAGVGPQARFNFELADDIEASAVNRVALTFSTDTVTVDQNTLPGFVRPMIRTLDLYGVSSEEALVLLARASRDDRGRFVFRSDLLAREIQRTLLEDHTFDHFEIRIPAPATTPDDQSELALLTASISAVLFHDTGAAENAPVAYLTLTPIDG